MLQVWKAPGFRKDGEPREFEDPGLGARAQ